MTGSLDGADLELTDEIATLLVAADNGDDAASELLAARYAADPGLHPEDRIVQLSPAGDPPVTVDLKRRVVVP
jgi:hypothetical protein